MRQTTMDRVEYLMAVRGYSGIPLQNLIEEATIIPIIDHPRRWKEDETRQCLDTDVIYNQSGEVFWVDDNGKATQLICKGYDKSCDSLQYGFHAHYSCPALKSVIK